jgi:Right handed beta helix region/CotH kinase protein
MIIRNDRSRSILWKRIALLGGVVLALSLVLLLAYRAYKQSWRKDTLVACDMETVVEADGQSFFLAGDVRLANGHTQVQEHARSGSHACKVSSKQEFGVTYEVKGLLPGETFEVSVWRLQASHKGMLIADASWGAYKEGVFNGAEEPGGWEQLTVKLEVPAYEEQASIKFYVWNVLPEPAYFDDFAVRRLQPGHQRQVGNFAQDDSVPSINMIISDKGMDKLHGIREDALRKGILAAGEDVWVNAKLVDGKQEMGAKVRLKGDWTDHLVGDKWSFRIALDNGFAWRRMTTFSVQNPLTRDFLSEWVYHQWLDKEGILTPRYEFIELRINGVSKGLYAYEEHFEKQLVEYKNRREGPILKFDEEGLWEVQEQGIANEVMTQELHVPTYQASDIAPFGVKAALKDTAMMRQVEIAQQLIQQYKTGQKNVWDIFDAGKVARYYAIIDMLSAQHGLIWHNQRWYYNPVISRMEPIGFDGFTEVGPLIWIDRPFLGFARNVRYMAPGYREIMFERFFHDRAFLNKYVEALMRFTDPAYLDAFYFEIAQPLEKYEGWVRHEWPDYTYNRKTMFDRAKSLRLLLMPLQRSSVKAHIQGQTAQGYHYRAYNYHCLPVVLLGVGKNDDKIDAPFTEEKLIDAYYKEFPAEYLDMYSAAKGKFIFFKVPGIDSIFHTDIQPWAEPEGNTPEQELFEGLKIASNEIYQVDEATKRVTFKTGKYQTRQDVLIPAGYQVWFEKGVDLDLIAKAKFISKSKVLMFGTEDAPILIHSSDASANGFTVLQAEGKSEFYYTVFDNLNTLHYKGWNLTGAVTLYESEIKFDRCRFVNNHCEDALNTVRCIFTFMNSYVGYTFGDGFDADFCHGTLTNATFSHTGNDCIDFSGSHIVIESATIDHAGDKGISLGEESVATIVQATVRNCEIGLAAKDLTTVTVQNIELYDNAQAFAAYQKKPEFGPGTIIVEKYKAVGNKEMHVLQAGSKLTLDGQVIEGRR